MIDLSKIRSDFPALANMIYLNAGSWGPMPTPVIDEIVRWYRFVEQHGDESHVARKAIQECFDHARQSLADLLGGQPAELAFMRAVSEGINVIAYGLDLRAGDEVIITNEEHPTGQLPWFNLQRRVGIEVRMLDVAGEEAKVLDRLRAMMNERTKAVVLSHVTTERGIRLPAREIVQIAHENGSAVGFDGAQSVGVFPIDLHQLDCDFYCINGSKWLLGPNGTAALYCRADFLDRVSVSWAGSGTSATLDRQTGEFSFQPDARRYEFGARHWNLYAGLGRAVRYLAEIGLAEIEARVGDLTTDLKAELSTIPGVTLLTPLERERSASLVTFAIAGMTGVEVSTALRERWNLGSRPAWHNACRVAIGFFTIESELEQLLVAIRTLAATTDPDR